MNLFLFRSIVIFHLFVCGGNTICFFALPFIEPPWIALPCCSLIFFLTFQRDTQCPMTNFENKLRQKLGMKTIKGFIGHYIIIPIRKWKREQKNMNAYAIKAMKFQGITTRLNSEEQLYKNKFLSFFHAFL